MVCVFFTARIRSVMWISSPALYRIRRIGHPRHSTETRRSMTMTRRQILMAAGAAAARPAATIAASPALLDFDHLMQRCAEEMLAEHPQAATSLGLDTGVRAGLRARWDDRSRDGIARQQSACTARLTELRRIDAKGLTADQRLTLDTVTWAHQLGADGRHFKHGVNTLQAAMTQTATPYVVSQMTGAFAELPDFLSREQPIADRHDVDTWLQRLQGCASLLDAETERLREDHARGVAPPSEVLNTVLHQMADVLAQPPAESDMAQSLARQCAAIGMTDAPLATAHRLIAQQFKPALARQHHALAALRAKHGSAVDERPGMQRLPEGDAHYAWLLKVATGTELTPEAIHTMGLEQSSRIAAEMEGMLRQLGYRDGSVGDRLQALASDARHRFANDDVGRAAAIAHANALLARGREAMPRLSRLGLRADVRIERVPPSIERGAAGAYVAHGSLDGARPAIFSLNLHDTAIWPRWALPTLVFHETVPGHVWQEAYGAEHQPWPLVRALVRFNASSEGWALYAEQLADEIGLYEGDTLGRLGYLQAMQLRASRLVVDTGLHTRGWARTQAIDWMTRSTGRPRAAMASEVDRYCVKPGQACGYMVGLQQLLTLRSAAQQRLGSRFDLRDFNDRVVASGNVPFGLLADRV
jgi:uncharacterized protein (DUF885 family)